MLSYKKSEIYVIQVSTDRLTYIIVISDLSKVAFFDGYKTLKTIPFAGPEQWVDDMLNKIHDELSSLRVNGIHSEIPIYQNYHREDIEDITRELVIKFNTAHIKENNEIN